MTEPAPDTASDERFLATYDLRGDAAAAAAAAADLCVEQTVEFPEDLIADEALRDRLCGRVESLTALGAGRHRAVISFAVETVGTELPQLLNVLFGNSSLKRGIRLVGLELPAGLGRAFPGPRFGLPGLRALLRAPARALLLSTLKPLGLAPRALAELAGHLARGGMDVVKDDHGLADQPGCRFEERVARCAAAVTAASAATGRPCLYAPNVSGPADELLRRARFARAAGAGALLVAPGLVGFDALRLLAADEAIGLPLLAHPALLGSYLLAPEEGIAAGVLLGALPRLAGADATIFPSPGGRFPFSPADRDAVVAACRAPRGPWRPTVPVPAGGMSLDRLRAALADYGADAMFLVGADLHRHGDLEASCRRFRRLVDPEADR